MAVIATFKAIPLDAFSDRPGGSNDPFVLANNDPDQFLNVTIDDDDSLIDGDTIINETPDDPNQIGIVTDAAGNPVSTDGIYVEWTATYTGTNGQVIEVWRFELDNGLRFFAVSEIPEVGITFTTSNKDQGADDLNPADIPDTPCLTRGALIRTEHGDRPVESLYEGDLILTRDNGLQPLRWIGRRSFGPDELAMNPKLQPVRIPAGSLGLGQPTRDLLVSRQHRMFVASKIAERMFGQSEILVPAIKLTALPGVTIEESAKSVEYYHLLFDRHEIIFAEGAATESLLAGPQALGSLSADALEEILVIFPDIMNLKCLTDPARFIPSGKQQKQLVWRHLKNNKPLLRDSYVT